TSLTVKQFDGVATLYRFIILDKPGDNSTGTLLYRETEDRPRSGEVTSRSEQPPETVLDRLDGIGYSEILTTGLDREMLRQ
ncbi:MAG: hypothetical protein SVU32_00805, partial [Candidatus Nanohaloarchaea archaeon]|nr:hypothetical protein [Candidatus Nanohaloarchaea archaeon]